VCQFVDQSHHFFYRYYYYTHLTASFPGQPGYAGTRKVKTSLNLNGARNDWGFGVSVATAGFCFFCPRADLLAYLVCLWFFTFTVFIYCYAFSALTLLVGRQEGIRPVKN